MGWWAGAVVIAGGGVAGLTLAARLAQQGHPPLAGRGVGAALRDDGLVAGGAGTAAHWDDAYALGETTHSWFQQQPRMSLRMLDAAGATAADSVIDVGGGASPLAGALLDRGYRDITVLDVSAAGLAYARQRLGARAERVQWLVADIRTWEPGRRYRIWHDRAVFHFLTAAQDRRQYLRALGRATEPGAVAVFGCFAPDGPPRCSGLPVARYSPLELAGELGSAWTLISQDREDHITPAGVTQPFTWAALRKQPGARRRR